MATVAINDGNGMMAMSMMAESAMATAAIAQVEDDIQQSARAAALASSQDQYDDVDYDPPTPPSPPPRSPSPTPTPAPRRPRQASPELAQRLRDRTLSEPVQRQGRSALCSRSPSRSRSPGHGGRHRREGLPCRGLSRHRRRRTWQSLPSLMAKIAISDGNLCHH